MKSKFPKSIVIFMLIIGMLVCVFITPHAVDSRSVTDVFSGATTTARYSTTANGFNLSTTKRNTTTTKYAPTSFVNSTNTSSTVSSSDSVTEDDYFHESSTYPIDYKMFGFLKYIISGNKVIIVGCDRNASGTIEIPAMIYGCYVTDINARAFNGCHGITEITIPDSVTFIGDAPFICCKGLKKITVHPDNKRYSNDVAGVLFDDYNFSIIQYPAGRAETEYTSPSDTQTVCSGAFSYAQNLESVFLTDRVGTIESDAFSYCSNLQTISFSLRVTKVRSFTFGKCPNLTDFYFWGSEDYWHRVAVESGNQDLLNANIHFVPYDGKQYYTEGIYTYILDDDGNAIIVDCDIEASGRITIPSKLNGHTVIKIDKRAFEFCKKITSVRIPDTVTEIGYNAFRYCSSLEEASLGSGVERIDSFGFGDCENLTTLRLPLSLKRIEGFGISGCPNLKDVYYSGTEEEWSHVFIWDSDISLDRATMHFEAEQEDYIEIESTTQKPEPEPTSPPTGDSTVFETIYFGSYPQSEVLDEALLAELDSLTPEWNSYRYYYGNGTYGSMKQGDYMKYADVVYKGNKYRAVTFSEYRPLNTYGKTEPIYLDFISHQHSNGYYTDNVYWFKYEPLEWIVLNEETNLLLCESVVDSQPYTNTIYRKTLKEDIYGNNLYEYFNDPGMTVYANDYATSSIRKWLNEDFYNTAFTEEEKSRIQSTVLDNSCPKDSKFNSSDTVDKVFLLSYADATNADYGFEPYDEYESRYMHLTASGTAYAESQGLASDVAMGGASIAAYGFVEDVISYAAKKSDDSWYLRTASYSSDAVYGAENGYVFPYSVSGSCVGVRPAVMLAEEVEEPEDDLTCLEKICRFFNSIWESFCKSISDVIVAIIKALIVIC